jgi:hypothetical protein
MSDPVRIYSDGTQLCVDVAIPPRVNAGKDETYTLRAILGGSDCAVSALAQRMQEAMEAQIEAIRREAYKQGARDRAMKATIFDNCWRVDTWRAGCQGVRQ